MTFDEMLKQAFDETAEERSSQMRDTTKKHRFSLAYRLWEHKMLRDLRRGSVNKHWTLNRARSAVVLGFAAAVILIGGTAVAAVNMGRHTLNDKREYSLLYIDNLSTDKTCIEEYYGLTAEGWVKDNYNADNYGTSIRYKYGNKIVTFTQETIHEENKYVNTENAVVEPISINEENDGFFIAFQSGDCGLYWIYDGYLFCVMGNLNKSELVNLAHSTKIVDF